MPLSLTELEDRLRKVEERFAQSGYQAKKIVHSELAKNYPLPPQAETFFGMFLGLCVDTIDPWKQNRVRYYNPLIHDPKTPIKALPWAFPISAMGGFDDSGLNWVPPAGSTLCMIFESGSRDAPYYIGTTWHRNRGPDGQHNWNFPLQEYYAIHEGHRKGYLKGNNDGSQVLPPWNTESYNGIDLNSNSDFVEDPEAQRKITYPNIYGFKTPQKHMVKMTDGDYKCNHKNKRIEILSSCGNFLVFKDDHIHEFRPRGEDQECSPDDANCGSVRFKNSPYFKHENELRPWNGPQTPQNNKCSLQQSGIQFLSISGHSFVMDDSVEQPVGVPEWEKSTKPFDFGCTDKFTGKTSWISATGHRIEMNDTEEATNVRGKDNYIRILTANGNKVELNDHTIGNQVAGSERGIHLQSTSNHTLDMVDEENQQASPNRQEGGKPFPNAKKAFVRLRSGYGLELLMKDDSSQGDTAQQQSIQIFSPQKNNDRGPHIFRMQEAPPDNPGQLFTSVGGNYICYTADNHFTIVGSKYKSDKFVQVSRNNVVVTQDVCYNQADLHAFMAEKIILLMAARDCKDSNKKPTPCVWPVLVLGPKGITISDRVFASASTKAPCASIFQLRPFVNC